MPDAKEEFTPTSASERKNRWLRWPSKLRRNLKNYLSTEAGLSMLIALVSFVFITGILASRYMVEDESLRSNVSNRDIYAEKTIQVEDKEETERIRYEAVQQVPPIYKKRPGADRLIIDRLVDFLERIQEIRESPGMTFNQKTVEFQKLLDRKTVIYPEMIQTVLNTSRWHKFYETSLQAAQSLINRGITSEDFRGKKDMLVRQVLPQNTGLSKAEEDVLVAVVATKLRPTLMIDEKLTEEARSLAAAHVKPVIEIYHKGDLIVRKGEKITELQRAALQKQGTLQSRNRWLAIIGIAILSVSLLSIVWSYLYRFEHSNFFKPAYAGLLAVAMVGAVGGITLLINFQPHFAVELYPIAILSLTICIFTHPRIAILTTTMVLLLCGLTLKIPLEALAVSVVASMVAIFVLARKPIPKDRNDLILAGLGSGIACGVTILALSFIYEPFQDMDHLNLFYRIWLGVLSGLFSGVLTLGILPIIEGWFKLVTPYTLLELGNHDRPILRRMQMEAPGTFHHSVMVATLAEAAAEAIGANPILTRVGALYHDIGKVKRPLFFVENQAYFGVENPHDKLTPRLSKMVITAHPRDGIEMAKQLGLPKAIMRFMPEHHGTLVAGYFYNKAVLQEGEENVNKAQFRYPGPKPQSKETAIVMLADATESSVRALKNPTITQVEERVDKIFKQRIDDGQFSECPITFQDIQIIRDTFIRVLRGIQHQRIEYQQNVLEELGKKPSVIEGLKQVSQNLKSLQDNPAQASTPAPAPVATAEKANSDAAPGNGSKQVDNLKALKEVDPSLSDLADEESGPGCC